MIDSQTGELGAWHPLEGLPTARTEFALATRTLRGHTDVFVLGGKDAASQPVANVDCLRRLF